MDTLTHGLLGALTVRALPRIHQDISRREMSVLGFVAAMLPDLDYLAFWIHPLQFLAEWHRGPTHSLVMLPLWSIIIGYLAAISVTARWKWRAYAVISATAIASHIISDTITIYGTQIFHPISGHLAVIGTTFLIDPYFSGIVLTGLLGSIVLARKRPAWHRPFIFLTASILLGYLGLQAHFRSIAQDFAQRYAAQNQLPDAMVHGLPQPFSPTYWKIIIDSGSDYHVSYIDVWPTAWHRDFTLFMTGLLSANNQRLIEAAGSYLPMHNARWQTHAKLAHADRETRDAWQHPGFTAFRKFAVFPIVYRIDQEDSKTCIWFTDLRYVYPVLLPPFRYGMCGNDNDWSLYRLKRFTFADREPIR